MTGIDLAKNFGQHAALMAGFHQAKGDIVVCLDDDGQTPPAEVGKLLRGIQEGADVVYARYNHKRHSGFRNLGSRVNDLMTRVMLGKPENLYLSSYFAVQRFVAEEIKRYEGAYPYVIGLILRTTNNIVNVDVNHRMRSAGTSGYTMGKLLALWFNGFTAFSVKPLRIATVAGALSAMVGFLYAVYTVIKKLVIQPPELVTGFSALMSSILFMGGMLMLMLGLVGEYIGRMYISMNHSPQYVIRETVNSARPGTDPGQDSSHYVIRETVESAREDKHP
jgi:undecaprenyl-phosphate 4-deoxy-4-formamido-L-arabinose transferase